MFIMFPFIIRTFYYNKKKLYSILDLVKTAFLINNSDSKTPTYKRASLRSMLSFGYKNMQTRHFYCI